MSDAFFHGWRAGMVRAAEIADFLGGDRYERPTRPPFDAEGRVDHMIAAQRLRARSIARAIRHEIEQREATGK